MNIELKCNFPQYYSFCMVFLYLIYSELSFCDEIFQKNITRKFGYLQIVVLSLHPLSGPGDVSGCLLKEFL